MVVVGDGLSASAAGSGVAVGRAGAFSGSALQATHTATGPGGRKEKLLSMRMHVTLLLLAPVAGDGERQKDNRAAEKKTRAQRSLKSLHHCWRRGGR